jgi:hypothetical protein
MGYAKGRLHAEVKVVHSDDEGVGEMEVLEIPDDGQNPGKDDSRQQRQPQITYPPEPFMLFLLPPVFGVCTTQRLAVAAIRATGAMIMAAARLLAWIQNPFILGPIGGWSVKTKFGCFFYLFLMVRRLGLRSV